MYLCRVCAAVCLAAFIASSCVNKKESGGASVTIWTYDSFVSAWGPGAEIAERFREKTGITVNWEHRGDAGMLLARTLFEGKTAQADIILGLDNYVAPRALASGFFEAYRPAAAAELLPELYPADEDFRLIPYDYSYFSFVYDSEKITDAAGAEGRLPLPRSLEDLTNARYKNKIILTDPRTSTPGLGFLSWTIAAYGDEWQDYWRRLRPSILTVSSGWDEAYGLFVKGEAPLVLSYTTSPAYHLEHEASGRYRAALFEAGQPLQIEFAGLAESAPHKENARRFLDFMLTDDFQTAIPLGNWMYPVTGAELPASFRAAPKPQRVLPAAPVRNGDINLWADILGSQP